MHLLLLVGNLLLDPSDLISHVVHHLALDSLADFLGLESVGWVIQTGNFRNGFSLIVDVLVVLEEGRWRLKRCYTRLN